jgi:hypothetical protein
MRFLLRFFVARRARPFRCEAIFPRLADLQLLTGNAQPSCRPAEEDGREEETLKDQLGAVAGRCALKLRIPIRRSVFMSGRGKDGKLSGNQVALVFSGSICLR